MTSPLQPRQLRDVYESPHGHVRVSPSGYVSNLHVRERDRGKGHGLDLMHQVAADADALGVTLTLHARRDLTPFYEKAGFEHTTDDEPLGRGEPMPRFERYPRGSRPT